MIVVLEEEERIRWYKNNGLNFVMKIIFIGEFKICKYIDIFCDLFRNFFNV